jgi:SET domain-containing protein
VNYQSEPITMWFDRRLVLRKSPIHNIGTFAIHDIRAGELLMLVTGGLVVSPEDRRSGQLHLVADMYNQESLPDGLVVLTPKLFHYYINHSCEANAVDITRSPNSTQYVALRDIHANEEITADYYDKTTLDVCNCNSLNCRWKKT